MVAGWWRSAGMPCLGMRWVPGTGSPATWARRARWGVGREWPHGRLFSVIALVTALGSFWIPKVRASLGPKFLVYSLRLLLILVMTPWWLLGRYPLWPDTLLKMSWAALSSYLNIQGHNFPCHFWFTLSIVTCRLLLIHHGWEVFTGNWHEDRWRQWQKIVA